jgi:hypothetical protein
MYRRLNRRLAVLSFAVLFLAVVPGMAYTGSWADTEGEVTVIVPREQTGGHNHPGDHHNQATGIQQCRVGPSKCTGQPSFVSATRSGDDDWTPAPADLSHEMAGSEPYVAFQPPVYRMKPPPRQA